MTNERLHKQDPEPMKNQRPTTPDNDVLHNEAPAQNSLPLSRARLLRLQSTVGNQAVLRMINKARQPDSSNNQRAVASPGAAGTLQRDTTTPTASPNPGVTVTPIVTPDQESDEELAQHIMGKQRATLVGWQSAVHRFQTVMTSSSDKETTPNFTGAVVSFVEDNLMKKFTARIPGADNVFGLLGGLMAEAKRASAAQDSANLRDFLVSYLDQVAKLLQWVDDNTMPFVTSVRLVKEDMLKGKNEDNYSMMRMGLVDKLEAMDSQLREASPEILFRKLSEQWLRNSMAGHVAAWIGILVEEDFSVREAQIHGPGGQKIAEQLLKDSPNGVDVYNMQVPKQIAYYKKGHDYPIFVRLDANGRLVNDGIAIEGDYMPVYKTIKANGLKPTKKVSGD